MDRKRYQLILRDYDALLRANETGDKELGDLLHEWGEKEGVEPGSVKWPEINEPYLTAIPKKAEFVPVTHKVCYGYLMVCGAGGPKRMRCFHPNEKRECAETCGGFERLDEYSVKLHCCQRIIKLEDKKETD